MRQSGKKRKALAVALLVLALTFSYLAISRINYRILLVGLGNLASPNPFPSSQVIGAANSGPGGNLGQSTDASGPPKQTERVHLTVTVLEDTSIGRRSTPGVVVNVLEQGEFSQSGPKETAAQIVIASGRTDYTGTVAFELAPGDYTVLAVDLGLLGELPITLEASKPEVSILWVFHSGFEPPLLVQMNDVNSDGVISPDETIALFFRGINLEEPHRFLMVVGGPGQFSIDLKIVGVTVYQNGIYILLSPAESISISQLRAESTILIGTIWYEVSIVS